MALSTCTVPGTAPSGRLSGDVIEVGLGIHGEPGMRQSAPLTADAAVDAMLAEIVRDQQPAYVRLGAGDAAVLLVNNLGGTPAMELLICARRAVAAVEATGARAVRVFVGPFMTALEMQGVSLSVLPADPLMLARLDAPTQAPGWQPALPVDSARSTLLEAVPTAAAGPAGPEPAPASQAPVVLAPQAVAVLQAVAAAVLAIEADLTEWDSLAGDGDCGVTMRRGCEALQEVAAAELPGDAAELLSRVADAVSKAMGGTSGVLFEIGLRQGAARLRAGEGWSAALVAGVAAIQQIGGAQEGYRTMLDALLPCVRALQQTAGDWHGAATAAAAGAERTRGMPALAGRANYVPEAQLAAPDPGAMAVAAILRAVADSV